MMASNNNINKKTMIRVLKLIKPYSFLVVCTVVCAVFVVALTLLAPILIGNAIDLIVTKNNVDFAGVLAILKKLLVVIILTAFFQWIMSKCNNHITYSVVRTIRTDCFSHLQKVPLKYIDANPTGTIINTIITDVEQFADGLLMGFTQVFTGVITIIGTLVFMLGINYKIALVVVVLTPLSFVVANFIAKKTYHLFKLQSDIRGSMTSLIDEMVGNQKIVVSFNHQDEAVCEFERINDNLQNISHKAIFFSSITNPSTRFVNSIVYAMVGITGAFAVINGNAYEGALTVGGLSCFLSYASQYTKPFNEISGVITELQNALACAAKVFELLDEEEMVEKSDAIQEISNVMGSVDIDNVSFSYDKSVKLIENLCLNVKPGQRVAIVGPTGCGKSTLINLIMRFYDVDKGSISLDGVDTMNITKAALRENIGMVLQDTWLSVGTIRDNIAYGKMDATCEEIINAAKMAHAHSFIKRLPNGYDTMLSENGGNLSQGQKQLLCIARVMLKLPPVLILDEATSSIDTRTEIKIQKAFNTLMEGRTSFVVAHRLSTIKESDVILVMKDGRIIEQGNHEELLKQNGFYKELYLAGISEPA